MKHASPMQHLHNWEMERSNISYNCPKFFAKSFWMRRRDFEHGWILATLDDWFTRRADGRTVKNRRYTWEKNTQTSFVVAIAPVFQNKQTNRKHTHTHSHGIWNLSRRMCSVINIGRYGWTWKQLLIAIDPYKRRETTLFPNEPNHLRPSEIIYNEGTIQPKNKKHSQSICIKKWIEKLKKKLFM